MKESTLWYVLGGLLVLMMGTAVCAPQMPGCAPPSRGGPAGGGPSIGEGPGKGPGADRADVPRLRPEKPVPGYEMFPVAGQDIPMGCAPVAVAQQRDRVRTGTAGAAPAGNFFGADVRGSQSRENIATLQNALAKIEEKYPGLAKGRNIHLFQSHDEYVQALRRDGDSSPSAVSSDAATSPDWRRVFISPKIFARGENYAIWVIAHEFGHIYTRGGEGPADRFATQLLGYSDPGKGGKSSGPMSFAGIEPIEAIT